MREIKVISGVDLVLKDLVTYFIYLYINEKCEIVENIIKSFERFCLSFTETLLTAYF